MDTKRIFSSGSKPLEPNAPASVGAPARSGGGSGVIVDVVLGVAAVGLVSLLFLELLVGLVVPGFQESGRQLARERNAKELERTCQELIEMKAAQEKIQSTMKSDYIGRASFPLGDSIEIMSVERSPGRMIVRGRYSLVSADRAQLALLISPTNTAIDPFEPMRRVNISKGSGNFTLIRLHVTPGLPHLNMYSTNASTPFAKLCFGTKEEAAEESKLDLAPAR